MAKKLAATATDQEILAAVLINAYKEGRHDMARERIGADSIGLQSLPDDELVESALNPEEPEDEVLLRDAMRMAKDIQTFLWHSNPKIK